MRWRRRRRGRRETAGWSGRYLALDAPGRLWARCRVLDISTRGAGLLLPDAAIDVGTRVVLDLELVRSSAAPVTVTGDVRYVNHVDGGARAGVRFVEVGELEQVLLQRLVARQRSERRHRGVVVPLQPSRAFD